MHDKELHEEITFVENAYYVTGPWKLGHATVDIEEHGIGYRQLLNVLYSAYVPPGLGRQPCLRMKHELPFWRMGEGAWEVLKRRAIGFSRKFPSLPDIPDGSLDDLRERLTGGRHG